MHLNPYTVAVQGEKMECNEDNCPIMLGVQNVFYSFMLGKPYKEREHNTGKPDECQEPETASKHGIKDTILHSLRQGDLNDDLFYLLRYALMKKSLLKKGEKLLPALERLDMDEDWYKDVWDTWGELEAKL
jgi:hypothetical protein